VRIVGILCIAVILWLFLFKPKELGSGLPGIPMMPPKPDYDRPDTSVPDGMMNVSGEEVGYKGDAAKRILVLEQEFLAGKQTADDAGIEEPLAGARPS
jgi:hypothetical protein